MTTEARPWFQEPWVWGIIAVPFSAVLFGIVMFVSANMHRDDLVVDEYYKDGMAINKQLALKEAAVARGVSADLQVTGDELIITTRGVSDSALSLALFHVTDKSNDERLMLVREGPDRYVIRDERVPVILGQQGIWYLELRGATEPWKLTARLEAPVAQWRMGGGEAYGQ